MDRKRLYKFVSLRLWFIVVLLLSTGTGGFADQTMEMIWSESDGLRHEIFTSSYRSGAWNEPVKITDDNASNLHPAVDVDSHGKRWAVWTAMEGATVEIRYAVYSDGEWGEVQTLPSSFSSSIKPSIIVDDTDTPWVVWTGNNGDDDDIYVTRFMNGEWTEEQRVHEDNDVPDILPSIDVDDQNRPVVRWSRFQDGGYVQVQSVWQDNNWSEPVIVEETESKTKEKDRQVVIPQFVNDSRQIFLRAFDTSEKE